MRKGSVWKKIGLVFWRLCGWYFYAADDATRDGDILEGYQKPVTAIWFAATVLLIGIPPNVYFRAGEFAPAFGMAAAIYLLFGLAFWVFHLGWEW